MDERDDKLNGNILPPGWEWAKLGQVAHLVGGGTPSRKYSEYFAGDIPWLTPTEVPKLRISRVTNSKERITAEAIKKSSAKIVPIGTVLMTSRASIGYVAIAGVELATNQGFASFIPGAGVHNLYLAFWLWGNADFIRQHATGTTFKEITKSKLRTFQLPLPPLPEQQAIVAKIEELFTQLDAGEAALKRAQANLKRYKASVLKAACEGRLVPTEADLARAEGRDYEPASDLLARILKERRAKWEADLRAKGKEPAKAKYKEPAAPDTASLPELPEGWRWATVEQVANIQLGRQRAPRYHHGNNMRKYIRAANITWEGIDTSDVLEMDFQTADFAEYKLRCGDVLLSEASGSKSEVGKPAIWRDELDNCCFQNTVIRVRPIIVTAEFLFLYFLYCAKTEKFGLISRGVNIHHLSASRLAKLNIPLPPLTEQARIVGEVEMRLSLIKAEGRDTRTRIHRAARLRQAILKRAFEGRLVRTIAV